MTHQDAKSLCLAVLKADSEQDLIRILKDAGYWDDPKSWRLFGDNESNWSIIGSQASKPEAAIVEKIINSVDHRLMLECQLKGMTLEGPSAPTGIREAVALLFEGAKPPFRTTAGRISEWERPRRTEVARGITFAATGATARDGNPCFTICDAGEGQRPVASRTVAAAAATTRAKAGNRASSGATMPLPPNRASRPPASGSATAEPSKVIAVPYRMADRGPRRPAPIRVATPLALSLAPPGEPPGHPPRPERSPSPWRPSPRPGGATASPARRTDWASSGLSNRETNVSRQTTSRADLGDWGVDFWWSGMEALSPVWLGSAGCDSTPSGRF